MEKTQDNLDQKIREEIEKTGFPLELRTSKIFQKHGYFTEHSVYYMDADDKKGREFDLRCLKNFRKRRTTIANSYWFRAFVAVECKKSDKPWIVLESDRSPYDNTLNDIGTSGFFESELNGHKWLNFEGDVDLEIESLHPYFSCKSIGRSYFEAFKGTESTSRIFSALISVVKASHSIQVSKYSRTNGQREGCVFYPLIVLEGDLYTARLENEAIVSERAEWTNVAFYYGSPNYEEKKHLVPIVRELYLEKFLGHFEAAHELFARGIDTGLVKLAGE